jgi:phospholipid/cholesterol/gamma-HCH transport system permease protein
MRVSEEAETVTLAFSGRLDATGAGTLWRGTMRAAEAARGKSLVLDLASVTRCDLAGAAFLLATEAAHSAAATVRGGEPQTLALLERARAVRAAQGAARVQRLPRTRLLHPGLSHPGLSLGRGVQAAADGCAFLGEAAVALISLSGRWRILRAGDFIRHADQAGVRALPLTILLGFLMGLILAFQSAIPLRRFGAELYVANLVAISLLRELGPLFASVIVSGRTGSAFAAEIGTMKVNQEIDALRTMGIDPMTMLVLPRLAATMLVMPALALALDLAGLAGMGVVLASFGFPPVAIAGQVARAARATDLFGGLFKAVCFGGAVAAIGCREGLATGTGPRAVGLAATGAVVGGIVSTIMLDGLFALLFFRLGL